MNEVKAVQIMRTIEHHARQLSELIAALGSELVGRPYKLHPNAVLNEDEPIQISEEEDTPLHRSEGDQGDEAGDPSQARTDRTTEADDQGGEHRKGRKHK